MFPLRLIMLLGLVAHKLLWEFMKCPNSNATVTHRDRSTLQLQVVKGGKVAALVMLLAQTLFLNILPISRAPKGLRVVGVGIYLAGLATAIAGRLALGKNWADIEDRQVLSGQQLVNNGIYAYVRHPIYAGDLLLVLGLQLALNSWLFLAVLPLLAVVTRQASTEEALLSQAFPYYKDYMNRTRRFIPYVM
ncbi:MAG: methyltransferase family protein [Chloroflexota bacterium]